jgi:hypothetical protein
MCPRTLSRIADGLTGIALTVGVGVVGVVLVAGIDATGVAAPRTFPTIAAPSEDRGVCPCGVLHRGAIDAVAVRDDWSQSDLLPLPDGGRMDRIPPTSQGDARAYLQEAASAARRRRSPGPGRGEVQTALWINAPAFAGNTSPPGAGGRAPAPLVS